MLIFISSTLFLFNSMGNNSIIILSSDELYLSHTQLYRSITSSEMCSLHLSNPSAHTPGAVDTHTHTHTHTHTWSNGQSGEQLGVRCLAQGSHLSRGQFLPEPRFEPTTSGYKSDALFITATTVP